jgi:hypothetical protein
MPTETTEIAPYASPSPPKFVNAMLNALISALLRSPLHRLLSNRCIVLSFKGRKSGKTYTFPVGYYEQQGDACLVVPLHIWWKNLRGHVPVTVWLKGRKYQGTADAFRGDEATVQEIQRLFQTSPDLRRVYKLPLDAQGLVDSERALQIARTLPLVRLRLTPV